MIQRIARDVVDCEKEKFKFDSNNDIAVNVVVAGGEISGEILSQSLSAISTANVALTTTWQQVTITATGVAFVTIQNQTTGGTAIVMREDNTETWGYNISGEDNFVSIQVKETVDIYLKMKSGTGTAIFLYGLQ